jgi:hypothetical protein
VVVAANNEQKHSVMINADRGAMPVDALKQSLRTNPFAA